MKVSTWVQFGFCESGRPKGGAVFLQQMPVHNPTPEVVRQSIQHYVNEQINCKIKHEEEKMEIHRSHTKETCNKNHPIRCHVETPREGKKRKGEKHLTERY